MELSVKTKGNKAAMIGWATLVLPFVFWAALLIEKISGFGLITPIFGSFTTAPSIVIYLLLMALPVLGFLMNLHAITNFKLNKTDDELVTEFRFKAKSANVLVILLTFINASLLGTYALLVAYVNYFY